MEHSGARIVLLDNDARIVELVEWFLGTRGFAVRTASSFAELRARLDEGPCDLLISDLDLGAESALTELPRLAAERALPPTLVVSGFLDATNQRAVEEVPGVVGTLPKPFEFEDLEVRPLCESACGGRCGDCSRTGGLGNCDSRSYRSRAAGIHSDYRRTL